MKTAYTPETSAVIVALYQAQANVDSARQQFKTAYERLQSSMRDIERDMESGYVSGTQYIQSRGNEMDAASTKLNAAIEAQKLIQSVATVQGISIDD
ncbi:MAG: hypothetical protein DCF32_14415 [Leptolyngbya sp.]|nr:MAG: hypothetical protein DCF32_14415 [Leptolyngbya sp.]